MKKFLFTIAALVFGLSQMTAQKMIFPEEIEVPQGGSAPLTITYETGGKVITTYMFNVVLPEGLSLTQGKTGMDWQMDEKNDVFNAMPNGTTGMACLSTDPSKYFLDGTEGTLGSVGLEADASLALNTELEVKLTQLAFSEYVGGTYETINFDDVVIKVKIVENRITLDENSTTAPEAAENVNVLVKRTIKAGNWNTICLPFAMTADQVKVAFGEGVQLADFNGCEFDGNKDTPSTFIHVKFVTASAIEANHPYLIKVSDPISEFKVDNVTINAEANPGIDKDEVTYQIGRDTYHKYNSFLGTFVPTSVPKGALYINSNKFYYSTGASTVKGFRGYFDFQVSWLEEQPYGAKIDILVDGDATSIEDFKVKSVVDGIYDLSGRKIQLENGDLNKLQKGVYIIDGKKVTIK